MIVSDITGRRLLVLPRDAARLGVEDPDSLEVALAIRMSASIPFYFEPVRFRNQRTGRDHLVVDGEVLSNFPVWWFDTDGEPRWPTFGLRLVEPEPRTTLAGRMGEAEYPANKIEATIDYIKSLVFTMMGGPRPTLHRDGRLRPNDLHPHPGRADDRLRPFEGTEAGTI